MLVRFQLVPTFKPKHPKARKFRNHVDEASLWCTGRRGRGGDRRRGVLSRGVPSRRERERWAFLRELRGGVGHGPGPRSAGGDRRRREAGGADPEQRVRLRVPVPRRLPLRRVHHGDEARARRLGRHRHHLLPDVQGSDGGGGRARRDRLRVPGERERGAVPVADQRVRPRSRRQGAADLPLVRPHRRLPQLHHPLEPSQYHLLGGRRAGARVQQPRGRRRAVPEQAGDEGARHHLGRRHLGHARRPGQDRLGARPLRRLLRHLRLQRLRLRGRRSRRQRQRRRPRTRHSAGGLLLPGRRGVVDDAAAGRRRRARGGVGARHVHGARLLRRPLEPRPARRVRHGPAQLRRLIG